MRILHISDLHFGDHNEDFKESLKQRVSELKPDLIIATGDMAENPDREHLESARQFLQYLENKCLGDGREGSARPRLIAVPGNHDVNYWGNLRIGAGGYKRAFGTVSTNHYFETENVWVYGFDSSTKIWAGANGYVSPSELQRFDQEYSALNSMYPDRFSSAFKIAVLHHHPVPIKYSAQHQRWLTLVNAGEFLGGILKHDIDLVLHGHEHTKALARYGRELRGSGYREVLIMSVGAALKNNPGADGNRFNLISIRDDGEIDVDYYGGEGGVFDPTPWGNFPIRTPQQVKNRAFELYKTGSGHYYSEIASVTILDEDGDARRIVECDDLTILDETKERAASHKFRLPETSGYIDLPRAKSIRGDGLLGLTLRADEKSLSNKSPEVTIEYGRKLNKEKISYQFDWWAVNGFAMNERESRFKYGSNWPHFEFTHFQVDDPIEDLTVIVQFPDNFSFADTTPEPFVAELRHIDGAHQLDRKTEIERRLSDSRAIRCIESMKIAALRIHRPDKGFSYGIQWGLPASPPLPTGARAGRIEELLKRLLEMRRNPRGKEGNEILVFLHAIADLLRGQLIPEWHDQLEISLQVFDPDIRKMVVIGAAMVGTEPQDAMRMDYFDVEFDFGEGVGGKVFKTNDARLYVRQSDQERKAPDFYREVDGKPIHAVLFAMPVRNPDDRNHVYAVLNLGSPSAACPLREVGEAGGIVPEEMLKDLEEAINDMCFEKLTEITLLAGKSS